MRLVKQSLEISAIEVEDGGDYICNVETVGRPLDQVHTLTVLVPPVIKRERGRDGRVEVSATSRVSLQCEAEGNPPPSISWTRLDGQLGSDVSVSASDGSLEIPRAALHHAGLYQCRADNGLPRVDSLNIQLVVLYPPILSVSHSWRMEEDSLVLELLCQVEADPPPLISWSRHGAGLTNSLDNVNILDTDSFQQKLAGRLQSVPGTLLTELF